VIDETDVQYVAAVYGVTWVVLLVYVLILSSKLGRLERELDDLAARLEGRGDDV
jgi:CcmD family protein